MPFVELQSSPHAPAVRPVSIHYRDVGSGPPIVFLHGGWGYAVYPIDRQIESLSAEFRLIIPDRSGYGGSAKVSDEMPIDFHNRAASETLLTLDALGIERAILWGHSDGSVIAAKIGLTSPERCERLILESFHFDRKKPASHNFFQRFAHHPNEINEQAQALLAADHGAGYWRKVVQKNCRVWLRLAAESKHAGEDLYDGKLGELKVPVAFIHGRHDSRTEPDEMKNVQRALPRAKIHFIENGRHSPHSEAASWRECNRLLQELVAK